MHFLKLLFACNLLLVTKQRFQANTAEPHKHFRLTNVGMRWLVDLTKIDINYKGGTNKRRLLYKIIPDYLLTQKYYNR